MHQKTESGKEDFTKDGKTKPKYKPLSIIKLMREDDDYCAFIVHGASHFPHVNINNC
jgi:hypothetical protein